MTLSQRGVDFIKSLEGLRLTAYTCSAGKRTIGWGHCINPKETIGTSITMEEADRLFDGDVKLAVQSVNHLVACLLEQYQFDALVSFRYNIGGRAFAKSTAVRLLNEGNMQSVPAAIQLFNKVTVDGVKKVDGGLTNRRQWEALLFSGFVQEVDDFILEKMEAIKHANSKDS